MDAKVITDEEGMGKCAWCDKRIDEGSPVYGFGIQFRAGVDLSKYEGRMIELSILTDNKNVPMMITREGSKAKNDGHDAMFMTCSNKCGQEMKAVLLKEKSVGDMFEKVNSLNN
ncbi:MAG: hypothetical protein SWH68_00890 [Thermodesulfobacteriota bacterium]|nr:hypothetical protein [Thermodesulfobacteriota bacterium]